VQKNLAFNVVDVLEVSSDIDLVQNFKVCSLCTAYVARVALCAPVHLNQQSEILDLLKKS
jgi:hypothetical protein